MFKLWCEWGNRRYHSVEVEVVAKIISVVEQHEDHKISLIKGAT